MLVASCAFCVGAAALHTSAQPCPLRIVWGDGTERNRVRRIPFPALGDCFQVAGRGSRPLQPRATGFIGLGADSLVPLTAWKRLHWSGRGLLSSLGLVESVSSGCVRVAFLPQLRESGVIGLWVGKRPPSTAQGAVSGLREERCPPSTRIPAGSWLRAESPPSKDRV